MTTKRTPINRETRRQIPPAAVEAFQKMEYVYPLARAGDVAAGDVWWAQHSILHREVRATVAVAVLAYPHAKNPYPDGSNNAAWWLQDRISRPEAFALYEALREAAEHGE
jgi:hypothetical protein